MAASCAEKTFATTTIADIVAHAGISRATFYKHFENKHECFEAAVEFFLAELEAVANTAHASAAPGSEALHSSTAAVLEILSANPAYSKLLFIEAPAVDPLTIGRYRALLIGALKAEWAPRKKLGPSGPDPHIAFGRAQVLMADYIATDRIEHFPELLRELVYIALLPFVGQDKALKQAMVD